jgi:uncharacterized protein (UPF0276 family)
MKIACNYYRETEELVDENRIVIDYFKFPALGFQMSIMESCRKQERNDFFARLAGKKPVLLHGLHPAPHDLASSTFIKDFDFRAVEELLALTKTPGISLHPSLQHPDPSRDTRELINTIKSNIKFLKQQYAHFDFISIENVDSFRFGCLIDPDVIREIVYDTDCSFLLDISHAVCASRFRNEDVRDYLSRLPLDRVYEIHLNGWIIKDCDIMCHTKINEEGYTLLAEMLDKCKPEIITIEYGRHNDRIGAGIPVMSPDKVNPKAKEEIAEQVNRINAILRSHV